MRNPISQGSLAKRIERARDSSDPLGSIDVSNILTAPYFRLGGAGQFSKSLVANFESRLTEATAKRLAEFKERDLGGINPFAIMLDTIHRGGSAFVVALGIDTKGDKHSLGFWEGATENAEICEELFGDLERRGL